MRKIWYLPAILAFFPLLALAQVDQMVEQRIDHQVDEWNQTIDSFSTLYTRNSEYRLGAGDLIEVSVFGVAGFNHSLRVTSSGMVKVPLAGEIEVAGLTPAEVEERLADRLSKDLIKDPQVSVFVREYRSQVVYVIGAVNRPGQYQITQQMHLIDVISMAGGLKPVASGEATLQRASSKSNGSTGEQELYRIDLKQLLEQGDLSLNMPVRGGDVVNIPERTVEVFYVIGEVGRAGAYELPEEKDLLISQALAQAGGPMKTAKANEGVLVRYDENGGRQELAVDFSDILKGEKPDFPVLPNDVIFIPGSTFKNIGYGLLGVIPNTLSRVPYTLTR